jgi:hypothetical protein
MGWSFRRSKKIGPFRFTLGKKGVGVSVGVKGARIGVGADGRTRSSVSIPGTGLSYRATGPAHSGGHPVESDGDGHRPQRGLGPWIIALVTIGGIFGLMFGGCLCIALIGSSHASRSSSVEANPSPPGIDGAKLVSDACIILQKTGFAQACLTSVRAGSRVTLDFAFSDFPSEQARITFDPATTALAEFSGDFPNMKIASPKSKLTIEAVHDSDSEWNKCLAGQMKIAAGTAEAKWKTALTVCARKYPMRSGWFHAFYDVAQRIVGGDAPSVTCSMSYLCGTGCTRHGDTCCIDVGHADQNCPGGGLCTKDQKCIGGTPGPQSGGGGGGGGCTCADGTAGCCGRGCCSHHGGIQ